MANPHKLWMMIGTFGAITGLVDFLKSRQIELPKDDTEPSEDDVSTRDKIVAWAESQEGSSDSSVYWDDALGGASGPYPKDWCGAFVLNALHSAGVAEGSTWAIGRGLEATLPKLTKTKDPKPGDIAYFNAKQHVAIVSKIKSDEVELVNGNSTGNKVVINTKPKTAVTAFYSIEPYLSEELVA
jgi:surface antigen